MPGLRVVLVDPVQQWNTWATNAHSLIEPLGLELIAAVLQGAGHCVRVTQAQGADLGGVATSVAGEHPDVVGITSYTYNAGDALLLAKHVKRLCPSTRVVYGGYHASFIHDALRTGDVDYIVVGPGERPMLSLLAALERGDSLDGVPNLVFLDSAGRVTANPVTADWREFVGVEAVRDKAILEGCLIGGLMYPPQSRQVCTAATYASRGCPNSCTYCASPAFYGCSVARRRPNDVAAEVLRLSRDFGTNTVYFTDLTFNSDASYVDALCDELIAAKSGVKWYALFRPARTDRAFAHKLRRAGCSRVSVGIEFADIELIRRSARGGPGYMDSVERCLAKLDEAGIITRGLVMLGHPTETAAMRARLLQYVLFLPVDDLRVGILTPFPGTELYEQAMHQGQLLTDDYRLFDARHVTLRPGDVAPAELESEAVRIYRAFHTNPAHEERLDKKAAAHTEFSTALNEFRRLHLIPSGRTAGVDAVDCGHRGDA